MTDAKLPVSESTFQEIQEILEKAGYQDSITYRPSNDDQHPDAVRIDMTGFCLEVEKP